MPGLPLEVVVYFADPGEGRGYVYQQRNHLAVELSHRLATIQIKGQPPLYWMQEWAVLGLNASNLVRLKPEELDVVIGHPFAVALGRRQRPVQLHIKVDAPGLSPQVGSRAGDILFSLATELDHVLREFGGLLDKERADVSEVRVSLRLQNLHSMTVLTHSHVVSDVVNIGREFQGLRIPEPEPGSQPLRPGEY